ncbi:MAG: hypothetical protein PXY39_11855 [archaeon]|nr:hypothetical protein [archaeon]
MKDFLLRNKKAIVVAVISLIMGAVLGALFTPLSDYIYGPPKYAQALSCTEAQILANQINSSNQSLTASIIQAKNGLCYLQYQVSLRANLGVSACIKIVQMRNGTTVSQYNGFTLTATTNTTGP